MINKLKFLIDEAEDNPNPKLKTILLKVAELKEENQNSALELIKLMINNRKQE